MADLLDITAGQDHEAKLALQNAGVSLEDYLRIPADPGVAAKVAVALRGAAHSESTGNYSGAGVPLLCATLPGDRKQTSLQQTIQVHMEPIELQLRLADRKLCRSDLFDKSVKELQFAPGLTEPTPGVRWVMFDPFAHWDAKDGHRVSDLRAVEDGWRLAGTESLSALKAWPEYGPAMNGTKVPHINFAGLRTASGGVPFADWWAVLLRFFVRSAGHRFFDSASPRVRECYR